MLRKPLRPGIWMGALLLSSVTAAPSMGAEARRTTPKASPLLLLQSSHSTSLQRVRTTAPGQQPRHRFYLELDGARAQAEDWLRQSGFALLEERDSENRHSYELMSRTTLIDWPGVRMHARLGQPQLSMGLQPRRQIPAVGFTLPLQQYLVQLECLDDQRLGWAVMGRLLWHDPHRRLQWGVALPVGVGQELSVGALFQVRVRFDQPRQVLP